MWRREAASKLSAPLRMAVMKAAGWVAKGYWRRSRFLQAFWCRFPGERLPRTGTRLRPPGNDIGVVAFHSIESYPRCGVPDRSLGLGRSCLGPSLAVTKLPSPTFAFSSSTHALTRSSVSFGTDHNHYVYVLRCRHCANVHGARLRYSPASMPLLPERRRGTSAGLAVGAEFRARPAKTGPRSQRQARSGRRRTSRRGGSITRRGSTGSWRPCYTPAPTNHRGRSSAASTSSANWMAWTTRRGGSSGSVANRRASACHCATRSRLGTR